MRLVLEEMAEWVGRAVRSRNPRLPVCAGRAAAQHALGGLARGLMEVRLLTQLVYLEP